MHACGLPIVVPSPRLLQISHCTMAVVVLPPPTTNWLSAHERSRLRRKTRKLGQLLGYMPHIIDHGTHTKYPYCGVHPTNQHPTDRITAEGSKRHEVALPRSAPSSRPSTAGSTYSESGSSKFKLSSANRNASLSSWDPPKFHKRRALSCDDGEGIGGPPLLQVLHPDVSRLSYVSVDEEPRKGPVNANTVRRQKMDKLRRVLGDDVPSKLVFKRSRYATIGIQVDDLEFDDSDSEESDVEFAVSPTSSLETDVDSEGEEEEKELPPIPRAVTSPRDSLLVPTAHKARRTSSIKRKPVPRMEAPTPPTPSMDIDELERAVEADIKKLFDIIEEECRALRNGTAH